MLYKVHPERALLNGRNLTRLSTPKNLQNYFFAHTYTLGNKICMRTRRIVHFENVNIFRTFLLTADCTIRISYG